MNIEKIRELIKNRTPKPIDVEKEYAVLIPIIERDDRLEVIFEVRSNNLNTQPGEISFPGGELEENETFQEAAIRETMEELNIGKENIEVLGELDYIVSYGNIIIRCFLGRITNIDLEDILPNSYEVDHIFTVPLDFFLEKEPDTYYFDIYPLLNDHFPYELIPKGREYNWRRGKYTLMFYKYKDYIIWGLTARLMKGFVDILVGDLSAEEEKC